jgi:hypothetical protein
MLRCNFTKETVMIAKPDLTNIASQDWSQYDFTRWNLEGLKLDAQPAALAGWVRDVTLSDQSVQAFVSGLGKVAAGALQDLQDQVKNIQARLSSAETELKTRLAIAEQEIVALEENVRMASAPVQPDPDPESFQISARVTDESTLLGLPGLRLRLYDARSPKSTIATDTTDQNGNALFKLDRATTEKLAKGNATITMEVFGTGKKSLFTGGAAPAPKLKQAGTILASLQPSADISDNIAASSATSAQQDVLLAAARSRVSALNAYYQQLKSDLQQQLVNVQGMIADLKSVAGSS